MGDGAADGPADWDRAHDDGVEVHDVRVVDGEGIGSDHCVSMALPQIMLAKPMRKRMRSVVGKLGE